MFGRKNIYLVCSLLSISLMSINCDSPLEEGKWIQQFEKGLPYNIYFPEGFFDGDDQFPVVLFLHGAGERGNDNKKQLTHIAPILSSPEVQSKYPSVLVFPQCPEADYWAHVNKDDGIWTAKSSDNPTHAMRKVIGLIEALSVHESIDQKRFYLAGLSMGGFGTFDLLSRHSDIFAAAIPICGGADTTKVGQYKDIPIWNFHGAKDPVVPVSLSRDAVQALKGVGSKVRYTEYPEGSHDVWNQAFAEPEIIPWLFSHRKT